MCVVVSSVRLPQLSNGEVSKQLVNILRLFAELFEALTISRLVPDSP